MPRPCRLFSKMLLASIGAGWEMDKLHCNAEAVDQLRFRRILAAKSEHLAKTPERFFPSIDDSEEKSPSADDFDVIDHKNKQDCRKWNPLLRDFELSVLDAREPLELSLEGPFNFELILRRIAPRSSPFAPDLVVVEDDVPVEVQPHHFLYEGHVEGDPQSRVFGSRIDVFDGHIYLSDGNSYTVQKVTKLRTKGLPGGHSIITRDKRSPAEIKKLEKEEEMREEERQKRSEDEEENEEREKKEREVEDKKRKEDQEKKKMKVEEQRENGKNIKYEDYVKQSEQADKLELRKEGWPAKELLLLDGYYKHKKYNNQVENKRAKICNMHLKIDHKLYKQILTNEGNNDPKKAREEIIAMLYTLMKSVNDIFASTRFFGTRGVQFIIKKISIETQDNDNLSEIILDKDSLELQFNYLARQSQQDHSEFCLVYVFTYALFARKGNGHPLGFSTIAAPFFGELLNPTIMCTREINIIIFAGSQKGVCCSFKPFDRFGRWTNRSYNTGVVMLLLKNGNRLSARSAQRVLAHELGHSLGARHDDETLPENGYLMNPATRSTVLVEYPNMSQFSSYSIYDMSEVLDALESYEPFEPEGKRDYGNKRNCLR
ncbi:hypothetical protein PRIPAC_85709, partial [Pristionchus pacificus]|uniref:Peptidase M12B domain-containing protein n=1 Tax=Pristionchus pacificus TaxID=54126 RepID=A0A2A6BRV5_PRIPA